MYFIKLVLAHMSVTVQIFQYLYIYFYLSDLYKKIILLYV